LIEVDVLAFHDRFTVCCMVAPEPLAVSDAELELLVKNEMFADAVPAAVGPKVTVKGTLCPAASVTGRVSPERLKAELLELVEDRVTLPPLAVTLPLWVWVVPMVTVPKLKEPGVTPRVPLVAVPLPVREIATEGSDALDARLSVALFVPVVVGANSTDRLALVPGGNV
jgi:hypothetical protein